MPASDISSSHRRRPANEAPPAAAKTAALLAAALLLALAGCRPEHRAADPAGPRIEGGERIVYPENAAELASLSTAATEPAPVGTVRTTGRLTWDEDRTARVFPPIGGRVRRLLADLGRSVGKGTPLAAIESSDFGQAQADANRAATDLAAAERTLARVRELYEHAAAPKKDLEAAQADRDRAKVESERTASRLALLGGRPGGARGVDQQFVLCSPIATRSIRRPGR